MKRFLVLSAIVYFLLLAGLISLRSEYMAFAIPFVLYLFFGFYTAPETPKLQIERVFSSERVIPNSDIVVTLNIKNLGGQIEELYLEDKISSNLEIRFGSPRSLMHLPAGASHSLTYTIAGPRGAYSFESIKVEACDALSLIRREQTLLTTGQLVVFPEVRRLKSISIRPRRTRVYAGMIPARAGGSGTEFFGVREYQPGDTPRSINWHASARHAEALFANEYQQERVADVGIVVDARERANVFHGEQSIFEYSVQAAATLSDAFISQGNRVGLLVYGAYLGWTLPGYGKLQRERVLYALARAEVGVSSVFEGLEHLSSRMFPPESQIVLVSSLVNDDLSVMVQLRARGYQVLVVSPDPVEFERRLLPANENVKVATRMIRLERDLLIRKLERAGVQVIEWDVSRPFDQTVGPTLMRSHPHGSVLRRIS
ncbi:MAG: DUF58 domain-containing protein [Anaerolineales bacterium]